MQAGLTQQLAPLNGQLQEVWKRQEEERAREEEREMREKEEEEDRRRKREEREQRFLLWSMRELALEKQQNDRELAAEEEEKKRQAGAEEWVHMQREESEQGVSEVWVLNDDNDDTNDNTNFYNNDSEIKREQEQDEMWRRENENSNYEEDDNVDIDETGAVFESPSRVQEKNDRRDTERRDSVCTKSDKKEKEKEKESKESKERTPQRERDMQRLVAAEGRRYSLGATPAWDSTPILVSCELVNWLSIGHSFGIELVCLYALEISTLLQEYHSE